MKKLILCFLLFSLICCNNTFNEESIGFNNFLQGFNTSIPTEDHLYIIIPTYSCLGCVQRAFISLSDLLIDTDKPNITIIYQRIDIDLAPFINKATLYYDSNYSIEKLPFTVANLSFIKTKNKKIIDIQFTNTENINQVVSPSIVYEIRKSD